MKSGAKKRQLLMLAETEYSKIGRDLAAENKGQSRVFWKTYSTIHLRSKASTEVYCVIIWINNPQESDN